MHRASASETWIVAIDTSASMGLGAPGKLQSAAEAAAAAIALGLRIGATVYIACGLDTSTDGSASGAGRGTGERELIRVFGRADLGRAFDALSALRADGSAGIESVLSKSHAPLVSWSRRTGAGRVLLFGDFLDLEIEAVLGLARGPRHVHLGQVFAPVEWNPIESDPAVRASLAAGEGIVWTDPERPSDRAKQASTSASVAPYLLRLEAFVENWSRIARDHGMSHAVWRSDEPFEVHVPELLR